LSWTDSPVAVRAPTAQVPGTVRLHFTAVYPVRGEARDRRDDASHARDSAIGDRAPPWRSIVYVVWLEGRSRLAYRIGITAFYTTVNTVLAERGKMSRYFHGRLFSQRVKWQSWQGDRDGRREHESGKQSVITRAAQRRQTPLIVMLFILMGVLGLSFPSVATLEMATTTS